MPGDDRNLTAAVAYSPQHWTVLARLVRMCFTPVAMVLLGNLALALPQIREGLWAFDDGEGGGFRRQVLFVLAFLFWAATAWYVARLTLGCRFPKDDIGASGPEVQRVARWLPRLLGLAACLPLAVYTFSTGQHPMLASVLVAVSILFLAFTWRRRQWFGSVAENTDGQSYYRYFTQLSRRSRWALFIAFAVPWLLMGLIWWAPIPVTRWVGAPALLLWAISGWTLFWGMVLSYAPRTQGWVSLGMVPALLVIVFSPWSDNHPIDWIAHQEGKTVDRNAMHWPDLRKHYQDWMADHLPDEPVYLIASAGGASRAAFWGAMALGQMEDEARQRQGRFGQNVFLLSGISGGSTGLAAYAAALRAWPAGELLAPKPPCLQAALAAFLANDVLSPVGGLMLYPDLLLRFLPLGGWAPASGVDRSRGLEQSWAQDWTKLMDDPPSSCPPAAQGSRDAWSQPLLHALSAQSRQPVVALNTVRLNDSRPVMQATVNLGLSGADDLLGEGLAPVAGQIRLAGAVHNSARFPFVSPPGRVRTATDKPWGFLGDGGYHEVSGAATVVGVIERLLALGCLRQAPGVDGTTRPARLFALSKCGHEGADRGGSRVVVVVLDGTPRDFPVNWQRAPDGQVRDWTRESRNEALRPRHTLPVEEVLGPAVGLLTHSAQARRLALDRLSDLAGTDPDGFIEIQMPRYEHIRAPSMNWQLDDDSRWLMQCALAASDACWSSPAPSGQVLSADGRPQSMADEALRSNLARWRAWLRPRSAS